MVDRPPAAELLCGCWHAAPCAAGVRCALQRGGGAGSEQQHQHTTQRLSGLAVAACCLVCPSLTLAPPPTAHAPQAEVFWQRIKQMQAAMVPVFVTVMAATRGGLVVQYEHMEGFIPISHLGQVRSTRLGCWLVECLIVRVRWRDAA